MKKWDNARSPTQFDRPPNNDDSTITFGLGGIHALRQLRMEYFEQVDLAEQHSFMRVEIRRSKIVSMLSDVIPTLIYAHVKLLLHFAHLKHALW